VLDGAFGMGEVSSVATALDEGPSSAEDP
jgi:hypothetical protein